MSRAPVAAFVALVIATVAAFFVTQHLKVTTPLIPGRPAPVPNTINPVYGGVCARRTAKGALRLVSYRRMGISFYLQNRSDNVTVQIVDRDGTPVRTIANNVYMRAEHPQRHYFTWNGRLADGSVAPAGVYYIKVSLLHQARTLVISNSTAALPVTVQTTRPQVRVTSVTPAAIAAGSGTPVTIRYTGTGAARPRILIFRITGGRPRQVKNYAATAGRARAPGTGASRRQAGAAGDVRRRRAVHRQGLHHVALAGLAHARAARRGDSALVDHGVCVDVDDRGPHVVGADPDLRGEQRRRDELPPGNGVWLHAEAERAVLVEDPDAERDLSRDGAHRAEEGQRRLGLGRGVGLGVGLGVGRGVGRGVGLWLGLGRRPPRAQRPCRVRLRGLVVDDELVGAHAGERVGEALVVVAAQRLQVGILVAHIDAVQCAPGLIQRELEMPE